MRLPCIWAHVPSFCDLKKVGASSVRTQLESRCEPQILTFGAEQRGEFFPGRSVVRGAIEGRRPLSGNPALRWFSLLFTILVCCKRM